MKVHENIGFCVAVAALLLAAAGWIAGGGNTVSAQTGDIRDCHYSLVHGGTTWEGRLPVGRVDGDIGGSPWILLLDECTGNTWILDGRRPGTSKWRTINR